MHRLRVPPSLDPSLIKTQDSGLQAQLQCHLYLLDWAGATQGKNSFYSKAECGEASPQAQGRSEASLVSPSPATPLLLVSPPRFH